MLSEIAPLPSGESNKKMNDCTTLKVNGDRYVMGNGIYSIDPNLKSLYKKKSFTMYPVSKHGYKNRVIFHIVSPYYWVLGKKEYLQSGRF